MNDVQNIYFDIINDVQIGIDIADNIAQIQLQVLSGSSQHSYQEYKGNYTVIPKSVQQVLNTQNKVMMNDIVIKKIPYYQTSNTSQGTTIYIGSEV